MELKERSSSEDWTRPSTFGNELQQNWDGPSILDYSVSSKLNQHSKNSPLLTENSNTQIKTTNQQDTQINQIVDNHIIQEWDPKATLNNLSFLKIKIHQLQELVHMIVKQKGQVSGGQDGQLTQQQQLITADLTSIIVQLISTAGSLLPSVNQSLFSSVNPQLNGVLFPSAPTANTTMMSENTTGQMDIMEEEHETKDDDDGKEEEHLPPGSYEILQLEKEEILAPHTHFCTICGKGFKRDANLRMHMRGHGDEYKTHAALAKPNKESCSEQMLLKRYSCPSVGCKRNKEHKKFQPLKTILCVKNHYKRTHCDKSYICSRCHTKKFSVIADLKTHEKHCGRDKWLCSCGTTFSRKDKLFGHIALFQGHTPAIPMDDNKETSGTLLNPGENCEANNIVPNLEFSFGSSSGDRNGVKANVVEDPYFSLFNYDCSLSGLQDFPQANFDDSSCSFSFLISGEKNGMQSLPSDID